VKLGWPLMAHDSCKVFLKSNSCFRDRIGVASYVILSLFAKEGKQANQMLACILKDFRVAN